MQRAYGMLKILNYKFVALVELIAITGLHPHYKRIYIYTIKVLNISLYMYII